MPNADNTVQAAFAETIHQRLLHSAKTIIFSSSRQQGESQLRVSPLMKNSPNLDIEMPLAATLAEQLSALDNATLSFIDDHIAPAIQAGEHVHLSLIHIFLSVNK